MTDGAQPSIRCRKCGAAFQPDIRPRRTWACPGCGARNANLKRHYRSVADACILGLLVTLVLICIGIGYPRRGLLVAVVCLAMHGALLLATVVVIYRSSAPWASMAARTLIWVTFGLAPVINIIAPLLAFAVVNIPALIVYALIFPYLFWLQAQAEKCTVPEPPPAAPAEGKC
jgi:hypothetical protein